MGREIRARGGRQREREKGGVGGEIRGKEGVRHRYRQRQRENTRCAHGKQRKWSRREEPLA